MGSELGPESFTSLPLGAPPPPAPTLGKEPSRRPRLPSLAGFPVNPAPTRPETPVAPAGSERPEAGRGSHRGLGHSRVFPSQCLSFSSDPKV